MGTKTFLTTSPLVFKLVNSEKRIPKHGDENTIPSTVTKKWLSGQ